MILTLPTEVHLGFIFSRHFFAMLFVRLILLHDSAFRNPCASMYIRGFTVLLHGRTPGFALGFRGRGRPKDQPGEDSSEQAACMSDGHRIAYHPKIEEREEHLSGQHFEQTFDEKKRKTNKAGPKNRFIPRL